jgi:hypothetical protein
MVTMVYEVKMTVCCTVEAKSKQEAKDKALGTLESLFENPLIDEVWVTQAKPVKEPLPAHTHPVPEVDNPGLDWVL